MEKHEAQRVAGILRADQVRKGHGHALGGGEAIFAVKNHAVTAIQQQHRGAGAVIFALVHHQVRIGHFDGNFRAFAAHGVEQRFADVHVQSVAEFVGARNAAGLDAGGEIARVMARQNCCGRRSPSGPAGF